MPRLSVNVISKGKYFKAGEEIPAEELSPNLLKYVDNGKTYQDEIRQQRSDADAVEWKPRRFVPKPDVRLSSKNYVKRNQAFKRADSVETIPGEPLFKKDVGAPFPRYVRYGKVSV